MDASPRRQIRSDDFKTLYRRNFNKDVGRSDGRATGPAANIVADITSNSKHHQKDNQSVECPRCKSSNTKFCYYNNYSLTQPRYFCKSCRRYWTQGGTLRNVPIGGSSRKNCTKTPSTSSSSSSSSSKFVLDMNPNKLLQSMDPMPADHDNQQNAGSYYFGNSQNQEMVPRMELAGDSSQKGLGLGSYMAAELYPTRVSSLNAAPEWLFYPHQIGEFGKLANDASSPSDNPTPAVDEHHMNRNHESNGYWNHQLF